MPAPVFYSVSMFGTASVETGAGTIAITNGVAVLSVEQTGNIGVGVEIEYNSLSVYIVPNRIGFDSGGTAELLVDTKIEGGTSAATGIVRFVELTSGTWAGGDAAGWIYFEKTTGTFQNNEQINRTKPNSSSNIATVDGTIEGNMGNGNTEFVVKTAIGSSPANQSATAVTSIHHVWATMAAFEGAFTGASYINNTDLTAADVVAHCCCYYDHDDQTADSTTTTLNWSGTQDATRYLHLFTPIGSSESINSQRHAGIWDDDRANSTASFKCEEQFTHLTGIQIDELTYFTASSTPSIINSCIFKYSATSSVVRIDGNESDEIIVCNTIVYSYSTTASRGIQTEGIGNNILLRMYYCTICGCGEGLDSKYAEANIDAQNNTVFNNTDDFVRGEIFSICDYNASDDGDGTNGVDWDNGATDWANVFNDYANGDFSLNNFTGTGTIIEQGTDLSSSKGIWRDIAGNERGATPDIGAFEYVAAGTTGNPWNYYAQQ